MHCQAGATKRVNPHLAASPIAWGVARGVHNPAIVCVSRSSCVGKMDAVLDGRLVNKWSRGRFDTSN